MSQTNIAEVLAAEAEHAEQHRVDALGPGHRRARPLTRVKCWPVASPKASPVNPADFRS